MAISVKDCLKFFGVIISIACAVFLCNMFLNYNADLQLIEPLVEGDKLKSVYNALKMSGVACCAVAGGSIALVSVLMLAFYIGHYIESNSARFGILKALGYSDFKIALKCAVFGVCVFIGAVVGYALSWAIMPTFYESQSKAAVGLPEVTMHCAVYLPFVLILLPTALFAALSVGIAMLKLKIPALALIRGEIRKECKVKFKDKISDRTFIKEMSLNVLSERKWLAFFVALGCFCFAAMFQMGLAMRNVEGVDDLMVGLLIGIGMVMAVVSLYLALSTVINCNKKKVAMLKVMGYNFWECGVSVLGMYHIPAAVGFVVGSAYQYGLLIIVLKLVFADVDIAIPSFDWAMLGVCLAAFIVFYELLNLAYVALIGRTSIKSVMAE